METDALSGRYCDPPPKEDKPIAIVVGKPLCDACQRAEVALDALGFEVKYLNANTPDGMAFLAERGYPLDETLTLPVVEAHSWPTKEA